jgi:hypothetical protein
MLAVLLADGIVGASDHSVRQVRNRISVPAPMMQSGRQSTLSA